MSFAIKINVLLTAILLMGMTFMIAVNVASAYTPNDIYWGNQWGPSNIHAPQAWDYQKGSTTVTVAILDTGIDYNHEDLAGSVIQGWNFVNNTNLVMDDNSVSHGTHSAGIAGAIMDNNRGIAGIAQTKLLAVKVCNFMGNCTWNSINDGITYAADNGAKVISMSFGRNDTSSAGEQAVNYAYTKGVLLVAVSGEPYIGNGTENIEYPAAFDNVIAVGATDSNDQRSNFSNYGAKLELVAPGRDIYSTTRNNGYGYNSGTSFAVPHVAGVAALIWSQYPTFSNNEVRQILTSTADDLGSLGRDIYYGYGKVNASAAVTSNMLSSWRYNRRLTITGSAAGSQTNYQMKLTVYNSTGTDTTGNIYLGGNVKSDFSDLRFTKSDGITLLNYWIESYTPGVSAVVWVKVDSIPASPNTVNIYLYYGNPSATSVSSGTATFDFFNNFESDTIGSVPAGWTVDKGTFSVQSETLSGITSKRLYSNSQGAVIHAPSALYQNTAWEFDVYNQGLDGFGNAYQQSRIYFSYVNDNNLAVACQSCYLGGYLLSVTVGGVTTVNHDTGSRTVGTGILHYKVTNYNNVWTLYVNGVQIYQATGNGPTSSSFTTLYTSGSGGNAGSYPNRFDNFRYHKYVNPEPTWGS